MKALILAAGRGSRMQELTQEKPKCLVELHKKPLLLYQIEALKNAGIDDIGIVVGYARECLESYIKKFKLHSIINPQWADSNMIYSLYCAKEWLMDSDRVVVSYSDIFYSVKAVDSLLQIKDDIGILYSTQWRKLWELRFDEPLLDAESFKQSNGILQEIGLKAQNLDEIQGQYMGLLSFSTQGLHTLFSLSENLPKTTDSTTLLNTLLKNGQNIACVPYSGIWGECDNKEDIKLYESLFTPSDLVTLTQNPTLKG